MSNQSLGRASRIAVGIVGGVAALGVAALVGVGLAGIATADDQDGSNAVAPETASTVPAAAADVSDVALGDDVAVAVAVITTEGVSDDRGPVALLRADLAAIRQVAPGDRAAAIQAIKADLLDGTYGIVLQHLAHHVSSQGELPAELRADLADLRQLPADERGAAIDAIRETARAGGYGPQIEAIADWLAARPS